uniref:SGNH hydrolase-type esterase domain-containing protein n=1 Tax=Romanomermis culicivorax TaxID=13658 RepID=A0A915JPZ1_ROMCU
MLREHRKQIVISAPLPRTGSIQLENKVAKIGRAIVRRQNAKAPSIIVFNAWQKFTRRGFFEQDGLHLSRRGKRRFEILLTSALDSL